MNLIFRFSRNFDENQVGRYPNLVCKTRCYAYHDAHPFTVLYWAAHALDYLGDVILVGDDSEITSCMGLKRVDSVTEALGMAQYIQCRASPSAIYMHIPPLFMCEVS